MAHKTKITILVSMVIMAIGGSSLAYYLYNKGPLDVKTARGVTVMSADLYHMYYTDTSVAADMFTGKVVEISGTIKDISKNVQQQQVVLLNTGTQEASVNCTMELPIQNIKPADKIKIKGICSGIGQGDPDLGIPGDVYISRCYSETK